MSVIKYRFSLDRKEAIYLSGEIVKGFVELDTELDIKKWKEWFHLELLGICLNKWEENPRKWQLQRQKHIFTREDVFYINCWWFVQHSYSRIAVSDSDAPVASTEIQNRIRYQFQFQLIRQLPTSCITPNGHIQYKILLKMLFNPTGRMCKLITHGQDQNLTIVRALNPNGMHLYEQPWLLELKPLLKCCLNQSCFAPGQIIHFVLTVQNSRYLHFIQSIVVELQEAGNHWGSSPTYPTYKKLQTRHTIDICSFDNIKYNRQLFKKHEHFLNFHGILKIPPTTVPSSNYPIYRKYSLRYGLHLHIYHLINIKIMPRYKWLQEFRPKGYGKLITIGTQPMNSNTAEPIERRDAITMNGNIFQCLEQSEESSSLQAFIPKY